MKPLLILTRIIIVGLIWSVFFMESIRVIMLRNWHFDILNLEHWNIAWNLWSNSWVISAPKEWAFVLIIISFIPLWFTGWIALSMISWGKVVWFVLTLPWKLFKNFFYKPVKIITTNTGVTPIRRKRSYKEIRPRAIRSTPAYTDQISSAPAAPVNIPAINPIMPVPAAAPVPAAPAAPGKFDHALFKFDDNIEDLDFDIDSFDVAPAPKAPQKSERRRARIDYDDDIPERPSRKTAYRDRDQDREHSRDYERRDSKNDKETRSSSRDYERKERSDRYENNERPERQERSGRDFERRIKDDFNNKERPIQRQPSGSCADIIKQKGYEVISRITVKNTIIDYIGVSADRICLCLLDREPGDWLADEERFNDEEPLWFSENSHRISPVRKVDLAKRTIADRLEAAGLNFSIDPFVIVQIGNIINAEDMFEIWDSLNVNVTRIDRGTPKEIKLFARALPEADKQIAPGKLDKLINILRNMA